MILGGRGWLVVGGKGVGRGLMMWGVVGEEREFASKLMNDWLSPRATTMNKPHVRTSLNSPFALSLPSLLPLPHLPSPPSTPQLTPSPAFQSSQSSTSTPSTAAAVSAANS